MPIDINRGKNFSDVQSEEIKKF